MADNVSHHQNKDVSSCSFLSICFDESTDITGSARLAIFGRYLVNDTIREELISLASLETITRGIDICNAVVKQLNERKLDLSKIVSVSIDGAGSMTGKPMDLSIYLLTMLDIPSLAFTALYTSKYYVQKLVLNHCRALWM